MDASPFSSPPLFRGIEHGNSRPGKEDERAVIDAYRPCDSFT